MDDLLLYLAAIKKGTYVLGPGYRIAIWVQGCPFSCKGCISPEWTKPGGNPVTVKDLVNYILDDEKVEGITLSGGEPMMQAKSLTNLLRSVKRIRPQINVICFTGYQLNKLIKNPPNEDVEGLLYEIDLLIDGPYVEEKNDNIGLRGSYNQKFHYLTDKLKGANLEESPRKVEIEIQNGFSFIVGIPTKEFYQAWDNAISQARKELTYERS